MNQGMALGIIESLSAGYRFVGTRFWLLIVPVALDLFLWLTPRLSVAPLFDWLANVYRDGSALPTMPAELADMMQTMADSLSAMGASSNLWTALVSGTLLHVPSLMATASLPTNEAVWLVSNGLVALLVWIGLALFGLFLGVIYLGLLARVLPIGAGARPTPAGEFLKNSVRHWLRVVGFVLVVVVILLGIYLPASVFISVVVMIVPAIGLGLITLMGFSILLVFLYLYFVTAGLVMDDLTIRAAIVQSVNMVRRYFWSVLGFILLTNIISAGIGLVLGQMIAYAAAGTLAAIVINAYVGAGLSMALLVFYRTRVLTGQNEALVEGKEIG
jgi:hypothetical protein